MSQLLEIDDPWRRLPWSLPLALLIGAALLWELGRVLERPPLHRTPPASIDAELVELSPPVERKVEPPPRERPKPAPRRREVAPKRAPVALPVAPPAPQRSEPAPPTPTPAPAQSSVPQAPVTEAAPTATLGAQAIVRPLPEIPEDLRQEAFNAVAVARFHVAADGAATFELIRPTPDPRLNRLLIEKLREWRFFPAMRDGKPAASDQDIRITLEVR